MIYIITSELGNIDLETAKRNTDKLFEIFIFTSSEDESLNIAATFPKYCKADTSFWKKIPRHRFNKHGVLFDVTSHGTHSIKGSNAAAYRRVERILKGL
jgi:hypothetical protein